MNNVNHRQATGALFNVLRARNELRAIIDIFLGRKGTLYENVLQHLKNIRGGKFFEETELVGIAKIITSIKDENPNIHKDFDMTCCAVAIIMMSPNVGLDDQLRLGTGDLVTCLLKEGTMNLEDSIELEKHIFDMTRNRVYGKMHKNWRFNKKLVPTG